MTTAAAQAHEIVISGSTFPEEISQRLVAAGFRLTFIAGNLHEDQVVAALGHAWGYVLGGAERISAAAWGRLPRLRCVCVLGTGVAPYLELPAGESPIAFTYTPHANVEAVAEFAVGLCVALVRGIAPRVHSVPAGNWLRAATPSLVGATVGILGMGHVGQELARILNVGFGARVCYWNHRDRADLLQLPHERCVTVIEVMRRASVVSLNCAYVPGANDGLVGAPELRALGADGYLVNTARAQLVDPTALRNALEAKTIAGAAIDGYYVEPAPTIALDPFGLIKYVGTERLIVTPHCAYLSRQAVRAMADMAATNLIAVAGGHSPPHRIA